MRKFRKHFNFLTASVKGIYVPLLNFQHLETKNRFNAAPRVYVGGKFEVYHVLQLLLKSNSIVLTS